MQEENSRLLFDDVHPNQYGSFGDQNVGVIQADPQEVQRETEALQKVVTHISKYVYPNAERDITRATQEWMRIPMLIHLSQPPGRYFCHGPPESLALSQPGFSWPRCASTAVPGRPNKDLFKWKVERYSPTVSRQYTIYLRWLDIGRRRRRRRPDYQSSGRWAVAWRFRRCGNHGIDVALDHIFVTLLSPIYRSWMEL